MDIDEATLPSTLTVEQDGKQIPLRDHPFVKESKDLTSLIKQGFDAHREVGARVRIPAKDKTEDVATFKGKLIEAGILEAPPGKPDDYTIEKPKELPENTNWDDALVNEFKGTMLKHGVPKGAAQDLINLHMKAMGTSMDGLLASTGLKVDAEKAVAELKTEFGDRYEPLKADAGRLASAIFKTPEELAFYTRLGLSDNPNFLRVLMRLAPLAQQDSSFMAEIKSQSTGSVSTREEARAELSAVMREPKQGETPHPMHMEWKRNTQKAKDYIDNLYKAFGDGRVPI